MDLGSSNLTLLGLGMPNAAWLAHCRTRVGEPQGPRQRCPEASFSSCCSTALAAHPDSQGKGQYPCMGESVLKGLEGEEPGKRLESA